MMWWTVNSPLFFSKIIEIERLALRAAISDECQCTQGAEDGLGGSEKNSGASHPSPLPTAMKMTTRTVSARS